MVGTMIKNRVRIPKEVKEVLNGDVNSIEIFWGKIGHEKRVSHVVKQGSHTP